MTWPLSLVQVQLSNKGLIEAPFTVKPSKPASRFGGCFLTSPEEGVIPSGACHTVKVSFSSHICGSFSEQLLVAVVGKPEAMFLTFR